MGRMRAADNRVRSRQGESVKQRNWRFQQLEQRKLEGRFTAKNKRELSNLVKSVTEGIAK